MAAIYGILSVILDRALGRKLRFDEVHPFFGRIERPECDIGRRGITQIFHHALHELLTGGVRCRGIVHLCGHATGFHQCGHSIGLCLVVFAIVVGRQHVVPVERRVAEIEFHGELVGLRGIGIVACAALRIFIVAHDHCGGSCSTARHHLFTVEFGTEFVVGRALVVVDVTEQGSDSFGE